MQATAGGEQGMRRIFAPFISSDPPRSGLGALNAGGMRQAMDCPCAAHHAGGGANLSAVAPAWRDRLKSFAAPQATRVSAMFASSREGQA